MKIKRFINKIDDFYRQKAVEFPEMEVAELESVFNIISIGFLFGYPIVPMYISLELIKDIDSRSIESTINKATLSTHPLSYLFSTFDVG